jgi:transcriptional regulator with XRE-family HTH domain
MVEDFMCNLKVYRVAQGLTQEQLAERCHVSTKHIANIEKRNNYEVGKSTIQSISKTGD